MAYPVGSREDSERELLQPRPPCPDPDDPVPDGIAPFAFRNEPRCPTVKRCRTPLAAIMSQTSTLDSADGISPYFENATDSGLCQASVVEKKMSRGVSREKLSAVLKLLSLSIEAAMSQVRRDDAACPH